MTTEQRRPIRHSPAVRQRAHCAGCRKLAPNGEPVAATRTGFDKLGRAIRTGRLAYLQGKAQPVQWMTRFEYQGDSFAPSVVARPSVVPGKEALTRIAYNTAGQLAAAYRTPDPPGRGVGSNLRLC